MPSPIQDVLIEFCRSYVFAASEEMDIYPQLLDYIKSVEQQCATPFQFEHFHKQIKAPFDYFHFGLNFLRPIVKKESSSVNGHDHLIQITKYISKGDNVVFLANHQTEADPQAISLLLEGDYPNIAENMIFVAGERVITDPLAIPFSMGCNLLCIYSKRYIDHPPEKKIDKQLHNKKTMQIMSQLLKEGGKCIYVAPSGGRDRKDANGHIQIAAFDPKSIEMFHLMAHRSKTPTHFFPMALGTYHLLPPPETVQKELGEKRSINRVGIHLSIGSEIDMENYSGSDHSDKHMRRKSRADHIWNCVREDYSKFEGE